MLFLMDNLFEQYSKEIEELRQKELLLGERMYYTILMLLDLEENKMDSDLFDFVKEYALSCPLENKLKLIEKLLKI